MFLEIPVAGAADSFLPIYKSSLPFRIVSLSFGLDEGESALIFGLLLAPNYFLVIFNFECF